VDVDFKTPLWRPPLEALAYCRFVFKMRITQLAACFCVLMGMLAVDARLWGPQKINIETMRVSVG
jgi:hypothetical protein